MSNFDAAPADEPTFYFIGVTTGKSSIMTVFPKWARHLGIKARIRGIDCKVHDDPEVYRRVVDFLKHDPLSLGALVTTHKLDLLKATRDMFDELDPYAQRLGEISCISKKDGKLRGHAKDPVTAGLSLEAQLPAGYWSRTGAQLCLLGAGGSSLATTMYVMEHYRPDTGPSKIFVTNRSQGRLDEMKTIHKAINPGFEVEYILCPQPEHNDAVVARLDDGSMVVNATGLGKDAPGSPLTDAVQFPQNALVWEFNYRGHLVFLDQARKREQEKNLTIEDGWLYFIHGWTRVIDQVFQLDLPTSGPEFDALSSIAESARS